MGVNDSEVVASRLHRGVLGGHGVITEVMHGRRGTLLSAVWLCRMDVTLNLALDICESSHLFIS